MVIFICVYIPVSSRIGVCFRDKRVHPSSGNREIPFGCRLAKEAENCIKEKHINCMGFFHRQIPNFGYFEYERMGEEIPECLRAFYSESDTNDDDEFPTLQNLDDELNKLLKNH